jgi:hypothetical protein
MAAESQDLSFVIPARDGVKEAGVWQLDPASFDKLRMR